jgi:ribosomal protein L3 glutamine methyltransferase
VEHPIENQARWHGLKPGVSVREVITQAANVFERAQIWFGHGSDNAVDEAAELVFFACDLAHGDAERAYKTVLGEQQLERVKTLLDRRIDERVPAAYLTHRMWFAGHEFYVDERVLVPRSPIAELINAQFVPWINPGKVRSVLDIGTGSGCIAIATALALPHVWVDAADVSDDALAVTRENIQRHAVASRVRPVNSDVFSGIDDARYDIIVSNPPYVGAAELAELPDEYSREPVVGLAGGTDGLDIVRRILREAGEHIEPGGILVVEVGNSETELVDAYPRAPFTWLDFEHGGGGVFVLTAEQVTEFPDW